MSAPKTKPAVSHPFPVYHPEHPPEFSLSEIKQIDQDEEIEREVRRLGLAVSPEPDRGVKPA